MAASASLGLLVLVVFIGLSIAGLVCLIIGLRGRAAFAAPTCVKCGYDLRALNFMSGDIGSCPECGAKLDAPGAVSFGRLQRWRGMIFAGAGMLVLPWLLLAVLVPVMAGVRGSGPAASAALSNQALVKQLATTADQPWDWQELERRAAAGSLSTSDIDAVFASLETKVKADRAANRPGHYPWARQFITANMFSTSPGVLQKFLQSYYVDIPEIRMRSVVREGRRVLVQVSAQSLWDIDLGQFCWALNRVTLDGKPVKVKDLYNPSTTSQDTLSAVGRHTNGEWELEGELDRGEHELLFSFDVGVVPAAATLRGIDGKPGAVSKWPSPIATWTRDIRQKIVVRSPEEEVIKVVEDKNFDPIRHAGIGVQSVIVRPASGGKQLVIAWKQASVLPIAIFYSVEVIAGGQRINFGSYQSAPIVHNGRQSSWSSRSEVCQVKDIAPEVKTIDIRFIPEPKAAEETIGVEEILGGEVEIKDVPLERYDLE